MPKDDDRCKAVALYFDEVTWNRYRIIADELQRNINDLMQSAIEETALGYFRNRKDDPATKLRH